MRKLKNLPVQTLIQKHYLKIERLHKGYHFLSATPHRHDHYELIWVLETEGEHYINFRPYPFIKDRVYFLQLGQAHQVPEFDREGWIFLISEELLQDFFRSHPEEEGRGLFDAFGSYPFVDMTPHILHFFHQTTLLLQTALNHEQSDKNILFHLISSLLLVLNGSYTLGKGNTHLLDSERNILLKLKGLIQKHYREEHGLNFYLDRLNSPIKTLNLICQRITGKTAHGLLEEKLLAEAKMALLSTDHSIKEIAFELGFNDPAYFGRFFKRLTGLTPATYRTEHS